MQKLMLFFMFSFIPFLMNGMEKPNKTPQEILRASFTPVLAVSFNNLPARKEEEKRSRTSTTSPKPIIKTVSETSRHSLPQSLTPLTAKTLAQEAVNKRHSLVQEIDSSITPTVKNSSTAKVKPSENSARKRSLTPPPRLRKLKEVAFEENNHLIKFITIDESSKLSIHKKQKALQAILCAFYENFLRNKKEIYAKNFHLRDIAKHFIENAYSIFDTATFKTDNQDKATLTLKTDNKQEDILLAFKYVGPYFDILQMLTHANIKTKALSQEIKYVYKEFITQEQKNTLFKMQITIYNFLKQDASFDIESLKKIYPALYIATHALEKQGNKDFDKFQEKHIANLQAFLDKIEKIKQEFDASKK